VVALIALAIWVVRRRRREAAEQAEAADEPVGVPDLRDS
jgi:hypothetical protein